MVLPLSLGHQRLRLPRRPMTAVAGQVADLAPRVVSAVLDRHCRLPFRFDALGMALRCTKLRFVAPATSQFLGVV